MSQPETLADADNQSERSWNRTPYHALNRVELGVTAGSDSMSMPQSYEVTLLDEERYRLLVDSITDYAIYMLDPDGRIASWNAGAQRFKGYEAWEILGEHFSSFYTQEDRAAGLPERALRNALTEGRFENEGWRVRKDGSRFWAHVVVDPIRDQTGNLLGYAKVTRDLTERKTAEAELKRSHEQFQLLVQGVTDYALYMLDPDGHVSNWNSGAERIKGYLADEIVGKHFSQFYTDEDREKGEPAKTLATARRDGRFEKEGWRQRKDGTRFLAHVIVDAIRNEQGEIIGFAKITRDITEKVQAQKALAQAREELFQSQKMEAIGQLTGGIAHDFNNLLMAILGSLQMLKKRMPDDPALTPLLENAIQGGERGAALTQRMLAFSRRQELNMKPVELGALINGVMDFLQRSLGSAVRIETSIPVSNAVVMTDAVQLETALLNLAVNARDAMPSGGTITIAAEEYVTDGTGDRLKPGRYMRLWVTDTGEGMDAETLEQATTPFFTTKGVGKGTGLGLSMVQGLTEQSGGKLRVESTRGKGTTVSLFLPRADSDVVPETEQPAAKPADVPGRSLTVLAVDDDALVLMNTTMMLEDLGHTVIEAYSGPEALDMLRSNDHIDLVITDHSMPRMTGSELANEIRSHWPHLPIVLATGYAELPSGGDNRLPRLPKPFSQNQLQEVMTSVLSASG
jgi:PAS domain S-box-containing protein